MFDIGWTEMMIIAVIALVILGPKELPNALKNVAIWVRKGRSVMREVQRNVDDLVREAELDEVKREFEAVTAPDLRRTVENTIDPSGSISSALNVDAEDKAKTTDSTAAAVDSDAVSSQSEEVKPETSTETSTEATTETQSEPETPARA